MLHFCPKCVSIGTCERPANSKNESEVQTSHGVQDLSKQLDGEGITMRCKAIILKCGRLSWAALGGHSVRRSKPQEQLQHVERKDNSKEWLRGGKHVHSSNCCTSPLPILRLRGYSTVRQLSIAGKLRLIRTRSEVAVNVLPH